MMSQFIDKYAAYEALKHEAEMHELPASREAYERAARIIDQMKPVYGEWLFLEQKNGYLWKCSLCNSNFENRFHFCPYCGSMMYS